MSNPNIPTGTAARSPGAVLITGGASGLGAATAEAVIERGGTALVIDRTPPPAREGMHYRHADLADTETVDAAVHELAAMAGNRLDGVVTAAGIDCCGRLEDVPAKDWERVVEVNLLGTAAVIRSALGMLQSSRGRIVTVASTLGVRAVSDASAYCASKFGVIGLTRALAAELAGQVGVTCLIPGGMHTAFFDDRPDQYKPPPDARLNDPRHVAETVLCALSQPAGCEIRELVVCASEESSWP